MHLLKFNATPTVCVSIPMKFTSVLICNLTNATLLPGRYYVKRSKLPSVFLVIAAHAIAAIRTCATVFCACVLVNGCT